MLDNSVSLQETNMWQYPEIDPVAIQLGPIALHWYAISYLVGIICVWFILKLRKGDTWSDEQISDLLFYGFLGVILGGRIGYMLFYGFTELIDNPLNLFKVWQGGMSFHGGMLGVFLGVYFYARKNKKKFFEVTDYMAPGVPLALGSGRIGNFINSELPGRLTEVPWSVIFPGESLGRHPSSLYQAILEGPVLFCLLWFFSRKPRPAMAVSGFFLMGYGVFRIFTEFYRAPDLHIGYVAFGWVTAGQLLSLPMFLVGTAFMIHSYRGRNRKLEF